MSARTKQTAPRGERPGGNAFGDPLIAAFDALAAHPEIDGIGIEMAMDFDILAYEHGADPDWSRPRLLRHQRARKGGLTTLARHGRAHYRRMAQKRWIRDACRTNKPERKRLGQTLEKELAA